MDDIWSALAGAGASLWQNKQAEEAAQKAADNALQRTEAAKTGVTQDAAEWANNLNLGNQTTTNNLNRDNASWINSLNLGNQTTTNNLNRENQAITNALALGNMNAANSLNLSNADYAQAANQKSNDRAFDLSKQNQTSDFGTSVWTKDGANGNWQQTMSVSPEQKALLTALRDKELSATNSLENGFGVNNDVMNAWRAQTAVGQKSQRDNENARLAAMGLATGSGSAWDSAQDTLNRSDNDAEQKNVLNGFNAWLSSQNNSRSNLAAAGNQETTMHNNSLMPDYTKLVAAQQNQVTAQAPGVAGINASSPTVSSIQASSPNVATPTLGGISSGTLAERQTAAAAQAQAQAEAQAAALRNSGSGASAAINWGNNSVKNSQRDTASDVTYDANGNPQTLSQAIEAGKQQVSDQLNSWAQSVGLPAGVATAWGPSIISALASGNPIGLVVQAVKAAISSGQLPNSMDTSDSSGFNTANWGNNSGFSNNGYGYSNPASSYAGWTSSPSSDSGD